MKKILIDTIQDGMIIARDICGSTDNVLLGKGTRLTQSLGKRLKNWGIPFIWIEGEEEQKVEKSPTETIYQYDFIKHLEDKFSQVKDNPIMHDLFVAVKEFKTRAPS